MMLTITAFSSVAIRRFNRFYTQTIGALDARFLGTEATLPDAEIDHRNRSGPKLPVAMKRLWLEI